MTSNALRLGYIRVSTTDQNPQLQRDALDQAGCDRIFIDHASCRTEIIPTAGAGTLARRRTDSARGTWYPLTQSRRTRRSAGSTTGTGSCESATRAPHGSSRRLSLLRPRVLRPGRSPGPPRRCHRGRALPGYRGRGS